MAPVQGVDGQVKPSQTTQIETFPNSKWNEASFFRESGFPVPNMGFCIETTSSYHHLNPWRGWT